MLLTSFEGLSAEGVPALVGGGGGASFLLGLGEGRWVAATPVGGRRTSFSRYLFLGAGGGARGGICEFLGGA